jgi:uncharacterized protein (TIGR02300 family)
VVKPEWGTKRICLNCGARFYDLQRDPIVCPACATPFDPAAQNRPRRTRAAPKLAAVAASAKADAKAADVEEDEVEVEVEEDDEEEVAVAAEDEDEEADDDSESAIEDVSELGDDDIDVIDTELDEEETER